LDAWSSVSCILLILISSEAKRLRKQLSYMERLALDKSNDAINARVVQPSLGVFRQLNSIVVPARVKV
jgi:hypothetical protein